MTALRASAVHVRLAVIVASCVVACGGSDGGTSSPTPTPTPPVATACSEGDVIVDGACQPLRPTTSCQPGTRAALGSATCVAVGTTACAPGFTAHKSGWGCVPVLPSAACVGATRESLGNTSCVPVGDCAAAFPPAKASVFVDASFTDAQLDATHFRSLRAAVDAVAANTTIAIAAGTYSEPLLVKRAVTLVGRCAEKVTLDVAPGGAAISVLADLVASGITVRGGTVGVDVASSLRVSLADMVLEQNQRAGINATDGAVVEVSRSVVRGTRTVSPSDTTNGVFVDVKGKVTLDESVVSGASDAGLGATGDGVITLRRSIVRDVVKRSDGVGGSGARAFEGAVVSFEESAIINAIGAGIVAGRTKGAMKLVRSTLVGTKGDPRFPGAIGSGANISSTGTLDATDSTFADNAVTAISVDKVGTRATLQTCVVVGTVSGGPFGTASSASATNGATFRATSSALVGGNGVALSAVHEGASLELESSLVGNVGPSTGASMLAAGHGGTALTVVDAAHATVTSSTIEGCRELAIGVLDARTTVSIDRTLVTDTAVNAGGFFGHGILGRRGAAVTLRRSVIEKSSGIGLAFAGASALVQGSFVRDNAIGIHVQEGSTLQSGAEAPSPVDPLVVFVTDDTRFEGNATRVGSGEVPLPDVIVPTP